jgi:hypothetical protein
MRPLPTPVDPQRAIAEYGTLAPEEWKHIKPPERTYTESEMRLERAAWQREAADRAHLEGVEWMRVHQGERNLAAKDACENIENALRAIPTDQPALDRHDAELRIDTMIWCTGAMSLNERDNAVIQKAIKEEEAKRDRLQQDHR